VLHPFWFLLYILFGFGTFSFLLELPIILSHSHLNPFCMKLKAEVSQVEDSIRELQQEINFAHLNATR
jgi:hypothetical protein